MLDAPLRRVLTPHPNSLCALLLLVHHAAQLLDYSIGLTGWLAEDETKPLGAHNALGEMAQTPVAHCIRAREYECDLRDALHVRCVVSGSDDNAHPPEQNVLKAIKLNAVAGEITTET